MPSNFKPRLAVALVAALVFFTNLGAAKLWDEDEPRNAACAREMFERGDWVTPTFNDELRTQKPVLLYWLIMAAYGLFGVNEFSARLPSAVLAVGTALITVQLGRLLFNARTGLVAGLMMATCLMFGVAGRAATPDSCLVFFATLSLFAYARAIPDISQRRNEAACASELIPKRWVDFALIYAAMALAVLAKGPIGVALPLATIGLFLLVVRQDSPNATGSFGRHLVGLVRRIAATTWSLRPLTMVMIVGAIAAPWYVQVAIRTDGEWTRRFFGTENLARFQHAMEGHSGSVLYYVVAVLVGFFPWSIVLPAGVWFSLRDAFGRRRRDPAQLLVVCWAAIWLGLFSLASTKLPSYVLPAYPALALMAASFLDRWLTEPGCVPGWLMHSAWGSLIAVGVGMAIALPLLAARYFPGDELIGLLGIVPVVGGIVAIILQRRRHVRATIVAVAATAAVLCVVLFGGVAVRVNEHQNSASLIEAARQQRGSDVRLGTFAHAESSVVYYAGRVKRLEQPAEVATFLDGGRGEYVITSSEGMSELSSLLPPDVVVVARQPRFLKGGEVFLLARDLSTAALPGSFRK